MTAAIAVQGLAVVLLVVAWYGAAGEVQVADQWAWGALGGLALALSALANAALIISFRRRLAQAAGRS